MKKIRFIALLACSSVLLSCGSDEKKNTKEVQITTTVNDTTMSTKTLININETVNGKSVQLSSENGAINSLVIDGKTIPATEYAQYADLTGPILSKLPKTPTPPNTNMSEADNEDKLNTAIEEQLKKDGVFKGENVKYEFDLTKDELKINGQTQSKEVLNKYLEIFKTQTGKEIGAKFHIKLREDRMVKK